MRQPADVRPSARDRAPRVSLHVSEPDMYAPRVFHHLFDPWSDSRLDLCLAVGGVEGLTDPLLEALRAFGFARLPSLEIVDGRVRMIAWGSEVTVPGTVPGLSAASGLLAALGRSVPAAGALVLDLRDATDRTAFETCLRAAAEAILAADLADADGGGRVFVAE